MNERSKLMMALMQINNLTSLIQGNEYQQFLYLHLFTIQVELERQLTNIQHSTKMKE